MDESRPNKTKPIFLSICDEVIRNDFQASFIPFELVKLFKLSFGDIIAFKVTEDREILCKIAPITECYCKFGYQCVVSGVVTTNSQHLKDTKYECEKKIYCDALSPRTLTDIEKVDLNVILSTMETVVYYKKNPTFCSNVVHDLLPMYMIEQNCIIKCQYNKFAKSIGVVYIIVKDVKFINFPGQIKPVGRVNKNTEINITKLESADHFGYQIEKPVSLGGLDHILQFLQTLVMTPWDFKRDFNDMPSFGSPGVLLVGPPGCGKSSIIRQLCAETQACLVATNFAEISSPYQGETQLNLAKVAKKACLLSLESPCVFFIDEIDAISTIRDEMSSVHQLRLSSQVLLTIDECKKYPNLLIMAATNRPYALEPAIRRSGRLEVEILLNAPTASQRKSILEVHSQGLFQPDSHSLDVIATATPAFVGADLEDLCNKVRDELNKGTVDPNCIEERMLKLAETTTPSLHKSLNFITSKPKSTQIGGLNEIRKELDGIFSKFLTSKSLLEKFKVKQPRGILLYGPRGCGKTRLISQLAAKRGFTFISANASHLLSPYVGDSEKRLAALFHSARLAQPAVLFIDEIDGIFRSRDDMDKGVGLSLLTELLQAMDGVDVGAMSLQGSKLMGNEIRNIQDGVIVCAATNHPRRLDPALLRPGRFDHLIYIPLPDEKARRDILQMKTERIELEDREATLDTLASITEGWSGAELEVLISQVAIKSVENIPDEELTKISIPKALILKAATQCLPSISTEELKSYEDFKCHMCH